MNEYCVNCCMCAHHCECEDDKRDLQSEDMKGWRCDACLLDEACMDGNAASPMEFLGDDGD